MHDTVFMNLKTIKIKCLEILKHYEKRKQRTDQLKIQNDYYLWMGSVKGWPAEGTVRLVIRSNFRLGWWFHQ